MSNALNVFHQPKPFYMIFSLELWERFGYYGVQAILAVYFVHQLGYSEAKADIVFGAFAALVYGFIAIGGKVGDSYLGTKRTMVLGAAILIVGYFILGLAEYNRSLFFVGLGVVVAGNSFFKSNPSSLLSRIYEEGDARLDGAFTMYYMSINLGSMFSMFLIPWLAQKYDWSIGFYVCSFGLVLCVFSYTLMKSTVKMVGSKPDLEPIRYGRLFNCVLGAIVCTFISAWLLLHVLIAHLILYTVGATVLIIYLIEMFKLTGIERIKMAVALVLIFESFVFFVLYSQMPTSLNFFAIHNVQHNLLDIPIIPESFQTLNPIWIVFASPILAYIYNHLGGRGRDLSMPFKFAIGMVLCSCAFLVLPLAAKTANNQGIIASYWMILTYGFQSIGELFISGLGLAMVAQYVPKRLVGFLMGMYLMSSCFGSIVAGYVASLTAAPVGVIDPIKTLPVYCHVFLRIGLVTAVIAALMLMTAPFLSKVINHNKPVH